MFYSRPLPPSHPDFEVVSAIESELLELCGGTGHLQQAFPSLIREAIDEVIDTPRTARREIEELEKTEADIIGTKVEILVRNFFGLRKGALGLKVAGRDVDVKNTIGQNWMIGPENIEKPGNSNPC